MSLTQHLIRKIVNRVTKLNENCRLDNRMINLQCIEKMLAISSYCLIIYLTIEDAIILSNEIAKLIPSYDSK